MKIIIPMAGMGKRMRPHTFTVPKPLIPVAGKPIVKRLVEDIVKVCDEPVDEIAFVVGDFGKEVENRLLDIASAAGARGSIHYQHEALGTAHAVLCAGEALSGKVVVAFADTLFRAGFKLDASADGTIWVHQVEDPSAFGVVKTDENSYITDFVEKSPSFVSDKAIIGIYYFREGQVLKNELQYLVDNDIKGNGEYQLTDALENMKNKGTRFTTGSVNEWLDCGNKDATLYTNRRILETTKEETLFLENIDKYNSIIIPPCFVGENVVIKNSVIGPHVSLGNHTRIEDSVIKNSIVQENTRISRLVASNSMIGNHVQLEGKEHTLNLGDYSGNV